MTYFRKRIAYYHWVRERFIALFGMGRGGSTLLWSLDMNVRQRTELVQLGLRCQTRLVSDGSDNATRVDSDGTRPLRG